MVPTKASKNRSAKNEPPLLPKERWQLQTAKARFSELFRRARSEGPQWVTRQGKEAVVILPAEEFERLSARSRQPKSLVQFFRESPFLGLELDFERDKDSGQEIEL
jgi:antitoxin Phd